MDKFASGYLSALRRALNTWNPLSMTSSLTKAVPKTMAAGALLDSGTTAIREFDDVRWGDGASYYKKVLGALIRGGALGAATPLVIPTAIHAAALPKATSRAYKAFTGTHKEMKEQIKDQLMKKFNMPVQTPPSK
jgi:hypothetical protein